VPKLSVTVVARNEAADLDAALKSAAFADEIVVVDAHSTDDTVAIARRHTDRVVIHDWLGHIEQKNYAASLATHDWILSLDADERVTPELADEIRSTLENEPRHAGFRIPRVTWHLGRWVRSTDWYPDYQDRLYDRRRAQWKGRYVHEALEAAGSSGQLRGEIQHYAYRDIADHLETIDRYTTLAARHAFLRNYIARGGIRDGVPGFIISSMNAYYVFLKFAKLWELSRVQGSAFKVQGSFEVESSASVPEPEPRTKNPETQNEP
jgi:glycosyltransferase involved in cell wall biosynthesis